jgi:predicted HicB family RNase H-like nuclease
MFKVNKPEMVNKTFRMPAELVERLTVLAQTQKVSLNNLVCQCCEYALDNLSDEQEDSE